MATILVIEDDEIMRKVIDTVLKNNGFDVILATDGKEAFDKIRTENYDVVLTDIMLPFANGLEIINKIRNESLKKDVGILVVSSMGNEDSVMEAFNLGANDYVRKPIMMGELVIRVKKLLIPNKVA